MSGHAWIAYTPDGGVTTTYGTWGNNPTGQGNGLFNNLEIDRVGDATRTMHLDDAAEKRLMNEISRYQKKGADAWQFGNPCSGFARDAWKAGTGEGLNANYGPINNPTTLKESIISANGGATNGILSKSPGSFQSYSSSIGRSAGSSLNSLGSFLSSSGSSK